MFASAQRVENFDKQKDRTSVYTDFLKSSPDLAGVTLKIAKNFHELETSLTKAKNAVDDYAASEKLRSLGRTGQILAAADKFVKAGGSVGAMNLPLEVTSLLNDPEARKRFELQQAGEELKDVNRRNNPFRVSEEERQGREGLRLGLKEAQWNMDKEPQNAAMMKINASMDFITKARAITGDKDRIWG